MLSFFRFALCVLFRLDCFIALNNNNKKGANKRRIARLTATPGGIYLLTLENNMESCDR
jgi:hypothetical protein